MSEPSSQPDSVPSPPVVFQRQLADAMPIIVWTNDERGVTTYLNETWTEYTGVSRAESLMRGVYTFVHPDDLPQVERQAREAREGGEDGFEFAYRLRRRDGAYRWHLARVRPVREHDASARGAAWVGTAMDIDDRRRAEEEQEFLVKAAQVLGTSLDPSRTLSDVARLVVPGLADWCAIDLLSEEGVLARASVAHVDPSKVALAWEVWRRFPPRPEDPGGPYAVLRARAPEHVREFPEASLDAAVADPELIALVRSLSMKSWIIVPLVARDRALGTLTLVAAESGRPYEEQRRRLRRRAREPDRVRRRQRAPLREGDGARGAGRRGARRSRGHRGGGGGAGACGRDRAREDALRARRCAGTGGGPRARAGRPLTEVALSGLALEKLTRILGPARGQKVYDEVLAATGRADVQTADDLHAFAEELSRRGGIEAAVGSLLSVAAVLRGAEPRV